MVALVLKSVDKKYLNLKSFALLKALISYLTPPNLLLRNFEICYFDFSIRFKF